MGAHAGDRCAEIEVASAEELRAWFARHHYITRTVQEAKEGRRVNSSG